MTAGAQRVGHAPGIVCEHNCLSLATAGAEMRAVALQNARVGNPVYHVILSWPVEEQPTDDQAFACGAHALAAVGMANHQYVFGIHRDTDNVHLHIAVNRVSPVTFRAVYPDRDFYRLDKAMRELELRFGWKHDHGPYAVFERGGRMVVDWRAAAKDTKGHLPTPAADMERHGDQESLMSYVRGRPRGALLELFKRPALKWKDLHDELARWGLELRERGQGLAVHDLRGEAKTPVKASDMHEQLSKTRLIARLGEFQPSSSVNRAPQQIYDRFRSPSRDAAERDNRREERAAARRGLKARYQAFLASLPPMPSIREEAMGRFARLRAESRRRRQQVRSSLMDRAARKAQYSIIAFETLRERERLRHQIQEERRRMVAAYRANTLSYRQWVEGMAATGDPPAISQLRGWAYGARRKGTHALKNAGSNRLWFNEPEPSLPADLLRDVPFRVRRDGTIRYAAGLGVIDHGDSIEVLGDGPSDDVILVALLLAARSKVSAVEARGNEAFERRARSLAKRWPNVQSLQQELGRRRHALKAGRSDAPP